MRTPTDDITLKMAEWLMNLYKGNTMFDNGVLMMITDKETLDQAVNDGALLAATSLGLPDVSALAPYIQIIVTNFYNAPENNTLNNEMPNNDILEEAPIEDVENVE